MSIFGSGAKRVAILGCGPAGMFAAHAFVDSGWVVTIYSRKKRSDMFGAQYLHAPIPGLPEFKQRVTYELKGTADGYRQKVYGTTSPTKFSVSPESLLGDHDAWDIRQAYFEAYDRYEHLILNTGIDSKWYDEEFGNREAGKYWKYVISTVPAPALCGNNEHEFHGQKVWAAGDAPELGKYSPVSCPPGRIICNGEDERAWYRVANVFGHVTCEWPHDRRPPVSGLAEVTKPLWTNCDCHTKGKPTLYRLGRYGKWDKGFLSHHAYQVAKGLTLL